MKKIIILFVCSLLLQMAKSQDTLANFYTSKLTKDSKIFIKQVPNKNIVYIFGITEENLVGLKLNLDSQTKKEFTIPFESSTREYRNIFFTDTSLVIFLKNKESKLNTYKLEYCFRIEKEIVTKLNIDAFDDNKTLASNIVDNNLLFYQKNNKSIVFTTVDEQAKSKTATFDIEELVKASNQHKSDFKRKFLDETIRISFTGDKDLIALSSISKCFINKDTAYLITYNFVYNTLELFAFNLLQNSFIYRSIKLNKTPCKHKHAHSHYSFCMINNVIAVTRNCKEKVVVNFYNPYSGESIKEYETDSLSSNALQYYYAQSTNFSNETSTTINNIKDDILSKINTNPFFVSCIPINKDNFILASGTYRLKGPTALGIIGFVALTAISLNNPIFTTTSYTPFSTYVTSYHLIPTGLLQPFNGNKSSIAQASYFATSFNTNTLQENANYKTAFLNIEKKGKEKRNKKELLSSSFIYNNELYTFSYLEDANSENRIVICK